MEYAVMRRPWRPGQVVPRVASREWCMQPPATGARAVRNSRSDPSDPLSRSASRAVSCHGRNPRPSWPWSAPELKLAIPAKSMAPRKGTPWPARLAIGRTVVGPYVATRNRPGRWAGKANNLPRVTCVEMARVVAPRAARKCGKCRRFCGIDAMTGVVRLECRLQRFGAPWLQHSHEKGAWLCVLPMMGWAGAIKRLDAPVEAFYDQPQAMISPAPVAVKAIPGAGHPQASMEIPCANSLHFVSTRETSPCCEMCARGKWSASSSARKRFPSSNT